MARVFISYRRIEPDQSVARLLYHHLSDLDHDVFLDAEHIVVGDFWDKQIDENVSRSDTFIPLVSSSYLFSPYIIEKELKPAARLLRENKIERILHVNLAYDGDPPEAVREVINQIQYFKWKSPTDTPRLCDEIAAQLPSAELFVKGMRSFVTADQKLFSQLGREDEIGNFLKLLEATQVSFVVVHGVSGAGKSSFLKAGIAPRLTGLQWTMGELSADADADFAALTAENPQLVVLDQFEQSLIRFSTNEEERRSFEKLVANWTTQQPHRKVIFCLRDEYRTAFDTMLPELSGRCVHFALLPLRPEVAARVLGLLLDSVNVEYDADFLPKLCSEYLAENVPKTVLPALLQLLAQYCQNRQIKLDKGRWDRLLLSGSSLFEDHVRNAVLERLPARLSEIEATKSLAALTEGEVKSKSKSVAEIAGEYEVGPQSVSRTLETASMPHARVVTVEHDAEENRPRYRLVHDLFVPAVLALQRLARRKRQNRRRVIIVSSLVSLLLLSVVLGVLAYRQWGVAVEQRNEAVLRRLTAESNALRSQSSTALMNSLMLAAEAHRRKPTWESDMAIRAALAAQPIPVTPVVHQGTLQAFELSPDATKLVTGTTVKGVAQIRVWETQTNNQPRLLNFNRQVHDVAFSDDGNSVLIGLGARSDNSAGDGQIVVWDLQQEKRFEANVVLPVSKVDFVSGTTRIVAVSSSMAKVLDRDGVAPEVTINFDTNDGLSTVSENGGRLAVTKGLTIKVYSLPDGKVLFEKRIEAEEDEVPPVAALAFNADGTVLAAAAPAYQILAWDIPSGHLIKEMSEGVRRGSVLAVSDDGALVAHVDFTGFVAVWHIRDKEGAGNAIEPEVRAIRSDEIVMRLAFRPKSYDLIAVTNGLTARYLSVTYQENLNKVEIQELLRAVPEAKITGFSLNSAGDHIVIGDSLGRATVWSWTNSRSAMPRLYGPLFSPAGRFLIAGTGEGFKLFDMRTYASGVKEVSLDQIKGPFAFSNDDSMFVVTANDDSESIDVYDSNTRQKLYDVKFGFDLEEIAFSSDGQRLFCLLQDGSLTHLELKSGSASVVINGDQDPYASLSPRGKYLIVRLSPSGSRTGEKELVRLFNVENLQKTLEVEVERHHFNDYLAFTADDKLVAGVTGRTVVAWDSATGRELWQFEVQEQVNALAFGGDGVLAIGLSREAIVLNVKTKEVIARVSTDTGVVRAVGISPDGQHVMVGTRDEKLRIWKLNPLELRVLIEGMEPRETTRFSPDGKYLFIHGDRRISLGVVESETRIVVWRPEDLLAEACQRIMHNFTQDEWRHYFGSERYLEAPCGEQASKRIRFAQATDR